MVTPSKQNGRVRGRPPRSAKQIADMRAHISSCALRLFQEEGYEAVSMRRLAQESDCTTMTIYKYFDNKIDILRALWAKVFSELFDDLDQIAAHEPDPQKRVHALARSYVTYWLDHRQHYFMVFMSGGISQADVQGFTDDAETLTRFDLFRTSLAEALDKDATSEELRLKSELLLCILNGVAHNLITISGYPWSDPNEIVNKAIDGLLGE